MNVVADQDVKADQKRQSRERNRVHAQRTRQRKKEQMMTLQKRAAELKEEQMQLRQTINEKNTATILVDLFATGAHTGGGGGRGASNRSTTTRTNHDDNNNNANNNNNEDDPVVEALLKRSISDIPDASQIPELPALILPGRHASKKMKAQSQQRQPPTSTMMEQAGDSRHGPGPLSPALSSSSNIRSSQYEIEPNDEEHEDDHNDSNNINNNNNNIDYELLGRDRSQCSPAELDLIRRERNRMHAKRTRDRKRLFTEQLAIMCRRLEDENLLLHGHLEKIDPDYKYIPSRERTPLPDTVVSSSARKKRSHLHVVVVGEEKCQKKVKTTNVTTTHHRRQDGNDDKKDKNVNVSLFDARMSTLLQAAVAYASQQLQTNDDADSTEWHEISDSCSATDEPDHVVI